MRSVLDTNVLIAAFISRGTCHELFEHCVREHTLTGSSYILDEFRDKLVEKFDFAPRESRQARELLASRTTVVEPDPLGQTVCRDPDDDNILAAALAGECACIVSGDKDLLSLGTSRGIDIIAPRDFWRYAALRL